MILVAQAKKCNESHKSLENLNHLRSENHYLPDRLLIFIVQWAKVRTEWLIPPKCQDNH